MHDGKLPARAELTDPHPPSVESQIKNADQYACSRQKSCGDIGIDLLVQESPNLGHSLPIPEEIRNDLGLSEGDQFLVIGEGDAVILKTISPPSIGEFHKLLGQARSAAKKAGIKRPGVKSSIAKVRNRNK